MNPTNPKEAGLAIFNIKPLDRFSGQSTSIKRPKEIACFSYDQERNFKLGDSSLAYYYPPSLPADLSAGFHSFQQLNDVPDEHLDALLETIIAQEKESGKKCDADIITWRGMMTKILTAPFSTNDRFLRNECDLLSGNNVRILSEISIGYMELTYPIRFIEENNSYKNEQKKIQLQQRQMPQGMASQELMTYWGYKFEVLSVLRKSWDETSREEIEGRPNEVVNNSAQYCSVVKTGFGKTRLVLGGEVDAIWDCKPDRKEDPIHWVELKTSAEIYNTRDNIKFQRKLLKFWAQSFLLGVATIIIGFRDAQGNVNRLETLKTASIPGKVMKEGRGFWDGNICVNFTGEFLEWLKNIIQGDGVWRIRKLPKSDTIQIYKLEESGNGDILSQSFITWRLSELGTKS
ncbi:RAI1-domain-containing protein [Penicillium taxi]|uniref:RAI1-domain-containing protein n=1 Tax=Penicillium taxi TaxID=168475 RepID=UPI00254536BE|nr:RAI1-domain-containing protein [Penicillium taxi]KAJ5902471.1 RAI1-domain-containing protein [Penicillium taxi]